jgi:DNA mismatch repair protein MutL
MLHKFPFTCFFIDIDPSLTDVNVHPQKMEIRFSNSQYIYEAVHKAIKNTLEYKELIPEISIEKKPEKIDIPSEPKEYKTLNASPVSYTADSPILNVKEDNNLRLYDKEISDTMYVSDNVSAYQVSSDNIEKDNLNRDNLNKDNLNKEKKSQISLSDISSDFMTEKAIKECKIIGQVFLTYWIVEFENNMYIIDQHAAHEKVNYERFMKKITENNVTIQELNPPIIVTLSLSEQTALQENIETFNNMGFIIEEFGGNEFALTGIPDNLPELSREDLFKEMLDSCLSDAGSAKSKDFMLKVATMSCKAAVKGNNSMDILEVQTLLNELLSLENPYNCPHGRPTIISMTKFEIDKKFKRVVE